MYFITLFNPKITNLSLLISVPTLYPFHLCPRLSMVETIESLGIGEHFRKEITSVLDETYR